MIRAFAIGQRVKFKDTGQVSLDSATGKVQGYHGDFFPMVVLGAPVQGYDPVVCITMSCLEALESTA